MLPLLHTCACSCRHSRTARQHSAFLRVVTNGSLVRTCFSCHLFVARKLRKVRNLVQTPVFRSVFRHCVCSIPPSQWFAGRRVRHPDSRTMIIATSGSARPYLEHPQLRAPHAVLVFRSETTKAYKGALTCGPTRGLTGASEGATGELQGELQGKTLVCWSAADGALKKPWKVMHANSD